jgi:uncharacterized membrane protein required for colicin V production
MSLNLFDVGFIVTILLSSVLGLLRGITKEFFTLISWSGSAFLAYCTFPLLKNITRDYVSSPMLADGITLLVIFLVFLICLTFLSQLLTSLVQRSSLNSLDRSLGFGFGVMRGCFILFLLEILISCIYERTLYPPVLKTSRFYDFMIQGSDTLVRVFPSSLQNMITQQRQKMVQSSSSPLLPAPLIPELSTVVQGVSEHAQSLPISPMQSISKSHSPQVSEDKKVIQEKQVEKLSSLKTKPPSSSPASFSKKGQADLERLLKQVD